MDEQTDERLNTRVERGDPRATRAGSVSRRSREADDREVIGDREISDDDRIAMFQQQHFNDILPNLPKLPGFHVCWLSTNHPNDTIATRTRWGYTPILASEVPGFAVENAKTAQDDGLLRINEMVAYKLPERLYEAYMQEYHHTRPANEAASIASQMEQLREDARGEGGDIEMGDGMEELRRSAPSKGKFSA